MKSVKKNTGLYVFSMFLFLSFLGLLGVFLIDDGNKMFYEMEENFLSHIVVMMRIKRINISGSLYVAFGLGYLATIVPIALLIINRQIRAIFGKKLPQAIRWIVLIVVCLAILAGGWFLALYVVKARLIKWKAFGLAYAYFGISFAVFSLIFFVVYIAVSLFSHAARANSGNAIEVIEEKEEKEEETVEEVVEEVELTGAAKYFPSLNEIDEKYEESGYVDARDLPVDCEYTLSRFVNGLQAYLATAEKLYYDDKMMRSFVSGMASSKLIILEGLSGTGKSSLPREFSGYVDNTQYISLEHYLGNDRPKNTKTFLASVQATWRDRTDVLGFYNDFSHVFKETETLKRLYEASYTPEKFNLVVLDEMNLSRVEYYFADFLSVMEHTDHKEWKISLMPSLASEDAPKKFYEKPDGSIEGSLVIPENTWFIGTANKDDSTFTITDKVYDRAFVIEFSDKNFPPDIEGVPYDAILITPKQLEGLFQKAQEVEEYCLNEEDRAKFFKLTELVYKKFEINFGNRIQMQIDKFVPVYVAAAEGKLTVEQAKMEALDIMFCRKVLHKLEGRFEDYIQKGLEALKAEIERVYGAGVFEETEREIEFMLNKLNG